ncbi:DUF4377 domain-containing protein, partial [Bacteroides salyersiae]
IKQFAKQRDVEHFAVIPIPLSPLKDIQGFEYEPGYEYQIRISETSYLDYNMSEPAWTEYKILSVISKEKKKSENLPDNFIPVWYYEQYCLFIDSEYRFAIDADEIKVIEDDIKTNPMVTLGGLRCCIEPKWEKWFLLDDDKKTTAQGYLKKVSKDYTEFPESYKILPPDGNALGYMQWEFINDNDPAVNDMKYDIFICSSTKNRSSNSNSVPWLYKELTEYYKNKYPEAGVKTVVVCFPTEYLKAFC